MNAKSEFTSSQGKGSGSALVELVKLNRKFKGDATFNIASPVFNFDGNLFYDADKDNSKKIHLFTNNELGKGLKSRFLSCNLFIQMLFKYIKITNIIFIATFLKLDSMLQNLTSMEKKLVTFSLVL